MAKRSQREEKHEIIPKIPCCLMGSNPRDRFRGYSWTFMDSVQHYTSSSITVADTMSGIVTWRPTAQDVHAQALPHE